MQDRAFTQMWDRIWAERYGVTDEKLRRFRYGMQVNSLGLTEEQPENNVQRIVLEMLGVTLSKDARARAIQLPCWNEALGLPTPWDQQWSLRIQQVLAFESDLLEYGDLFEGSKVVEAKVAELVGTAEAELQWVLDGGGWFAMIDAMKGRLVQAHAERVRRIESGEQKVVGVNSFTETAPSPLAASASAGGIITIDPAVEQEHVAAIAKWRTARDQAAVDAALAHLCEVAATTENLVPATVALARVGGTVGEWAGALREVFGEYRAPTGVSGVAVRPGDEMQRVRERVQAAAGAPIRILVGKPGLDGHSNGAEQIAVAARDAGMEVVYQGIRLTPAQIAAAARDEDVDIVGLSILSGSHRDLVPETVRLLRAAGVTAPVVVGGIIPDADPRTWKQLGSRGSSLRRTTGSRPSWRRSPTSPWPTGTPHPVPILRLTRPPADETSDAGTPPRTFHRSRCRRAAAGVVGVATDSAMLGIVAGAAGVMAAMAGVALGAAPARARTASNTPKARSGA